MSFFKEVDLEVLDLGVFSGGIRVRIRARPRKMRMWIRSLLICVRLSMFFFTNCFQFLLTLVPFHNWWYEYKPKITKCSQRKGLDVRLNYKTYSIHNALAPKTNSNMLVKSSIKRVYLGRQNLFSQNIIAQITFNKCHGSYIGSIYEHLHNNNSSIKKQRNI